MAEKTLTEIGALRNFFGMQPGQTLQQFAEEVRQLTPAEKTELATAVAKELGVELTATKV